MGRRLWVCFSETHSLKFVFLDTVTSTNDYAVTLIKQGEDSPFWVVAKTQTQGRGRRGRKWVSETGNLYCTGVYPVLNTPQLTGHLSFVAAIALVETLKDYLDETDLSIKWPNDVLVGGAKVAGVLLEIRNDKVLIGVGVNLINAPEDTPYPISCVLDNLVADVLLSAEPLMPTPESFLAVYASRFEHLYSELLAKGFHSIREKWLVYAKNIPGPVTVNLNLESFKGEAIGLGVNGELQVRGLNGTVRDVYAGDVFFNAASK